MAAMLIYRMMTNTRPGSDLSYKLLQLSDFIDKENVTKKLT